MRDTERMVSSWNGSCDVRNRGRFSFDPLRSFGVCVCVKERWIDDHAAGAISY